MFLLLSFVDKNDAGAKSTILAEDPDLACTVFGFSDNGMGSEDESELTGTTHRF